MGEIEDGAKIAIRDSYMNFLVFNCLPFSLLTTIHGASNWILGEMQVFSSRGFQ